MAEQSQLVSEAFQKRRSLQEFRVVSKKKKRQRGLKSGRCAHIPKKAVSRVVSWRILKIQSSRIRKDEKKE
jgi:hypothetical protein